MSPRVGDEEAEVGIHELSGRGREELDYETYRAQHAMGTAPAGASQGQAYVRYPGQDEQMQREEQQLMPTGGASVAGSPATLTQGEQMRLQRLSLGLGNMEDRDEGFL